MHKLENEIQQGNTFAAIIPLLTGNEKNVLNDLLKKKECQMTSAINPLEEDTLRLDALVSNELAFLADRIAEVFPKLPPVINSSKQEILILPHFTRHLLLLNYETNKEVLNETNEKIFERVQARSS